MSHKSLPGIKPADLLGFVYPRNDEQTRIAVLRYAKTGVLYKFKGIGSPALKVSLCFNQELKQLLANQ
jgi:hypothetical protein